MCSRAQSLLAVSTRHGDSIECPSWRFNPFLASWHPQIDTEGFDATVIMGAMESIARGRIGVISFEYHEVGVWREYSLRQVVSWLDGFNYVW